MKNIRNVCMIKPLTMQEFWINVRNNGVVCLSWTGLWLWLTEQCLYYWQRLHSVSK